MKQLTIHKQQKGAALIVGLIMLLVMTIIGISGMSETIMEEKMLLNFRDRNAAQHAADSSLRATEAWMAQQTLKPTPIKKVDCSTPPLCGATGNIVWDIGELGTNWEGMTWANWVSNAVQYKGSGTDSSKMADIHAQPRTVLEFRSFNEATNNTTKGIASNLNAEKSSKGIGWHFYNIYGASTGYREETVAVVQSTFKKWY